MITINKILPQSTNIIARSGKKRARDYKLLSRQDNLPVQLPAGIKELFGQKENPKSCSSVLIGKISDALFSKEIKTFYDKSKRILLRLITQNGQTESVRYYKYGNKNDRFVSVFKPASDNLSQFGALKDFCLTSKEYLRVTELHSHEFTNPPYPKRVSRKKVEYFGSDGKDRRITFIKTPFNLGIGNSLDKRILSAIIKKRGNNLTLDEVRKTDNFNLDTSDKYLKVRFLDPRSSDGIAVLTRQLLDENNLGKLKISVHTDCVFPDGSEGCFSAYERSISYKDFSQEAFAESAVECAAHEVDHAVKYAQIGRLGKGVTAYEADALRYLGEITDFGELRKAVKYSIAKDNYPANNKNSNNPAYLNNYLEVKAREAGEKAADEYENSKNYNFFEEFMPVEPQ